MKGGKTISLWLLGIFMLFLVIPETEVLSREVTVSPSSTFYSDLDGRVLSTGVAIGLNNNVTVRENPGEYAQSVDEPGASTPGRLEFFPFQVLMLQGPISGNF